MEKKCNCFCKIVKKINGEMCCGLGSNNVDFSQVDQLNTIQIKISVGLKFQQNMQMKFDKAFLKMVVGNCPTDHKTFIKIWQLVICGIGLNRDKLTNHMDTIYMKSRIVEEGKLNRQCCENRLEMRKTEIRSHVILKKWISVD